MRTFDKSLVSEGLAFALGLFDKYGRILDVDLQQNLAESSFDYDAVVREGIGRDRYFCHITPQWELPERGTLALNDTFPTEKDAAADTVKW